MAGRHGHSLFGLLHLFRAHVQLTDEADFCFSLCGYGDDVSGFRLLFGIGESSTGGSEAGDHERGAGQDEPDGASVDSYRLEGVRVLVDDLEVGDDGVIHVLVEERSVV